MPSNQSKQAQQARVDLTKIAFKKQDAGKDDEAWLALQLATSPKRPTKRKK
jgi:hypothetical protein